MSKGKIGIEEGGLAETEGGIALRVERLERVLKQIGHSILAVLIQHVVEANERPHLLGCADLIDNDCAHVRFCFPLRHNYRAKIRIFVENIDFLGIKNCKFQHYLTI